MVAVGRLVVAVAIVGLCTPAAYADVIPTRRSGDTSTSAEKIEKRLLQLGVSSETAKDHLKSLTDDQTNYFAANPERIQLVGQENWGGQSDNLWWEWVLGLAALAAVAWFIVFEIHNQ